jgi:hypothetical protein
MEDKVEILKEFLPSQLVEAKSIYGILGKGVHELTEEECLKYFPPLKLSIELILNQKIEETKRNNVRLMLKNNCKASTSNLQKVVNKFYKLCFPLALTQMPLNSIV